MKRKKNLYLTGTYILLTVLAVIWLIPIIWIFLTSFRGEGASLAGEIKLETEYWH